MTKKRIAMAMVVVGVLPVSSMVAARAQGGGTPSVTARAANAPPLVPVRLDTNVPLDAVSVRLTGQTVDIEALTRYMKDLEASPFLANVVLDGTTRGVVIASEKISIAKIQSTREVCEAAGAWTRVFRIGFLAAD